MKSIDPDNYLADWRIRRRAPIALCLPGLLSLVLFLYVLRWLHPGRAIDETGIQVLWDSAFTLGFVIAAGFSGTGVGFWTLKQLRLNDRLTILETLTFSLPLGLGLLAYGVFALTLVGWLSFLFVIGWIGVFTIWGGVGLSSFPLNLGPLGQKWRAFRQGKTWIKISVAFALLVGFATLMNALTPAWDQDGLMYHLQGAKSMIDAGKMILLPEIWTANGPFTIEMLYLLGLLVGTTSIAKIIHLTFAAILVLATYSFGKRFLGKREALVALAILAGWPLILYLGSTAYVDIAWAVYGFLGMYALILWQNEEQDCWLVLSGIMLGLAIGTKYLAWAELGVLELWLLFSTIKRGWKSFFYHGLVLGIVALVIASPWYLKNWFLAGNPIYPLVFGGAGWDSARLSSLGTFFGSFGSGKSLLNFLLLPVDVFIHLDRYATFPFEILNVFFIIAPLYFLVAKTKALTTLGIFFLFGMLFWGLGMQQIRFLLPFFPGLSLISSYVLIATAKKTRRVRWHKMLRSVGLLSVLMLQFLMVISFLYFVFWTVRPIPVLLGAESDDAFLSRMVGNYQALQYVQSQYPPGEGISLLWDGTGYYCDHCALATIAQWTQIVDSGWDPERLTKKYRQSGINLILVNQKDRAFFLSHDPTLQNRSIADFMENEYLPACGREVYRDEIVGLYEIICN
jgi:4-amino-4-deoxy-L-arabinose transferase-like glycosyltransferase